MVDAAGSNPANRFVQAKVIMRKSVVLDGDIVSLGPIFIHEETGWAWTERPLMYDKRETSRLGEINELLARAEWLARGWRTLVPDYPVEYDFMIEKDNVTRRIQVKGMIQSPDGRRIATTNWPSGKYRGKIDLFMCFETNDLRNMYWVPEEDAAPTGICLVFEPTRQSGTKLASTYKVDRKT